MRVADVISGSEGPAGVRWLLRGREPRAALRRVLRAMLVRPGVLGGCRLIRAKYRTNHKLTATFEARLRDPNAAPLRPVAVMWSNRDKDDRHAGESVASLQAEALRRGTSAPFRELVAEAPVWAMRVWVAPLDERFPQLLRLSDPAYVHEMLGRPAGPPQVHWIRYRPRQRHLLQYDVPTRDGLLTSFVKVYSGEAGRRAYEDANRMCDWLAVRGAGFASLRPLAYLAGDTAVLFPRAPGTPLSEYFGRRVAALPSLLERAGAALRVLQSAPGSLAGSDERRDFAVQVAATGRSGQHRTALLPSVGDALQRLLDRARRVEERICREPDVFAHGDFKAAHWYVAPSGFTLIDFDSRCLADPGYDAGKFLADLQWWLCARGPACVEQAQAHFLAGYAPAPDRLVRVRLWEAVMLAHLSIRRLLLFDGDWAARLECMLGRADAALKRVEAGVARP